VTAIRANGFAIVALGALMMPLRARFVVADRPRLARLASTATGWGSNSLTRLCHRRNYIASIKEHEELVLATKKAKKKATFKRWTSQEIKSIKQMAKGGTPTKAVAKALKRTVAAVRIKASAEGISLRQEPAPRKKATDKAAKKKTAKKK
jgi:hypothetical protein